MHDHQVHSATARFVEGERDRRLRGRRPVVAQHNRRRGIWVGFPLRDHRHRAVTAVHQPGADAALEDPAERTAAVGADHDEGSRLGAFHQRGRRGGDGELGRDGNGVLGDLLGDRRGVVQDVLGDLTLEVHDPGGHRRDRPRPHRQGGSVDDDQCRLPQLRISGGPLECCLRRRRIINPDNDLRALGGVSHQGLPFAVCGHRGRVARPLWGTL